jgi:prepilin-type N-terminal cleavage/methylation domain-containing protein
MLSKLQSKKEEGFTIIEVLIVLAIAGLIMLIVFLAVPALQRQSRNTGRRDDVGRFGAAVNDFAANHNGALPSEAQTVTVLTDLGALNQYTAADRVANAAGIQAVLADTAGQPRFRLVTGAQCSTTADGATVAGSSRQASIQFQLETSSNAVHTDVCQNI